MSLAQSQFETRQLTEQILVVGGGPVGMRFAEEYCRLGTAHAVTVLGDEPWQPYDRVRLSAFLARELRHEALYAPRDAGRLAAQLEVIAETRIVRIDREQRCVYDQHGQCYRYDKLVLATGSRPRVPPVPGRELAAVFVFGSMSDAQALLARQIGSRCTVVVGGGLLGLEAARAMLRFNTEVHVLEHVPRLMFHQLDERGSELLRAHVEALGIQVHTGAALQQIIGPYKPSAVRLRSGVEIPCDTVLFATGIEPNVELARDAGLAVSRGIRVDDFMRTNDPSIYAIGECCEHREQVYGLVGPGIEQAAVAANNVAGREARYAGSVVASSLKVVGCPVFSMGDAVESAKPFTSHSFDRQGRYRRINVYRGRLIGAVGIGDWDVARMRNMGLENRRIWPWQSLWFRHSGRLWLDAAEDRVASWPADATVCTCRGVSRGRLSEAVTAGAACLEILASATGASTVCGACKTLLADLLGDSGGARVPIRKTLLVSSLVGAVLAALAFVISLPYLGTVTGSWRWDQLWTESLYKQVSGFSLLGLGFLVSLVSLRKRLQRFSWGTFSGWQLAHVVIGVFAVLVLLAHTGFRFGANLNAWLTFSFSGLLVAGGVAGATTALAGHLSPTQSKLFRSTALWLHILLLWPLPALLGFHVLKSYYF